MHRKTKSSKAEGESHRRMWK